MRVPIEIPDRRWFAAAAHVEHRGQHLRDIVADAVKGAMVAAVQAPTMNGAVFETITRHAAAGLPDTSIAERLGLDIRRVRAARQAAGIPANRHSRRTR